MESSTENTEHSFTSLLIVFLFVLFAVFISDHHDSRYPESAGVSLPVYLIIENTRGHFDAEITRPVDPPVVHISLVSPLQIKNPDFLSLQKELSVFNNEIQHLFISLQYKSRIIKPLMPRKYLYRSFSREDTEIPA